MVKRHRTCRTYGVYGFLGGLISNPTVMNTTGPNVIKETIGRDPNVYYIPSQEYMPCDNCIADTEQCPSNSWRYFTHLKGRSWNSTTDGYAIHIKCFLKYNWKLLLIVLCWVVYTYRNRWTLSSNQ